MSGRTLAVAIAILPAVGCLSPHDEPAASAPASAAPPVLDVVGTVAAPGERPRGIYVVIPPAPTAPVASVKAARPIYAANFIIYMNRDGGVYTPGFNNSSTNSSSVAEQTTVIEPWNVSDEGWNQVMDCVRDQFARWDVEVTDVDPGDVPHIESVVAGFPQDLGFPSDVGGVSPFTRDCSVINRSIVFTFAEVFGNDFRTVCEVAAQEIAHSFGLDHEFLCEDPMTYLSGCGNKSFQDIDAPCGEFEERECACGGFSQNSVEILTARIGLRDDDPEPEPDAGPMPDPEPDAGSDPDPAVDAGPDPEPQVDAGSDPDPTNPDPDPADPDVEIDAGTGTNPTPDPPNPADPGADPGAAPPTIIGGCQTVVLDKNYDGGVIALFLLGALILSRRAFWPR